MLLFHLSAVGVILALFAVALFYIYRPTPPPEVEAPCPHSGRCFRRGGEWVSCRRRKRWLRGGRLVRRRAVAQ